MWYGNTLVFNSSKAPFLGIMSHTHIPLIILYGIPVYVMAYQMMHVDCFQYRAIALFIWSHNTRRPLCVLRMVHVYVHVYVQIQHYQVSQKRLEIQAPWYEYSLVHTRVPMVHVYVRTYVPYGTRVHTMVQGVPHWLWLCPFPITKVWWSHSFDTVFINTSTRPVKCCGSRTYYTRTYYTRTYHGTYSSTYVHVRVRTRPDTAVI